MDSATTNTSSSKSGLLSPEFPDEPKKSLVIAAVWALKPDQFTGGEAYTPDHPMTEDCWWIPELELELRAHPMYLMGEEVMEVLNLWRLWRATGGVHLPGPGGLLSQPACLMAAFRVMDAAAAALQRQARS